MVSDFSGTQTVTRSCSPICLDVSLAENRIECCSDADNCNAATMLQTAGLLLILTLIVNTLL